MGVSEAGIVESVQYWASRTPDYLAYTTGECSLTYAELARQSDNVAAFLLLHVPHVEEQAPIAIYGHKEPEMLVACIGILKAGRAYVPIDVSTPPERAKEIAKLSHAALTLTPDEIATVVRDYPGVNNALWRSPQGEEPFYIMFTSGSTGRPKGAVITAANVKSFLHWMLEEQRFKPQTEVFLDQVPYSFDVSVMGVFPSLITGNTLSSISKDDIANPARLYRRLAESHITTWISTPSFARLCLAEKTFSESMLPDLRRFLFCGETLAPHIASTLIERFPRAGLWNTYGPTEATVAVTSVHVDQDLIKKYDRIPLGYAKPEGCVRVLKDGTEVSAGESGEIVIRGPQVSPGYPNEPELSQRVFSGAGSARSYRTGDRGYMHDGLLFFEGRFDHQIKLHGYRIEIGDVEANIRALPGVYDAVVVVREKDGVPDSLATFVIVAPGGITPNLESERALRIQLSKRLPAYMVPQTLRIVDDFPLTTSGKVDRAQLAVRSSI